MASEDAQRVATTDAAALPRTAGFRMPAEWAPHDRCLMAWPSSGRGDVWREFYPLAQASYAAVARAIAAFEPVLMIARPDDAGAARSYCGSDGVEVLELPIDDSWVRDSGPIFVVGPGRELAVTDFRFNSWGERYLPYDADAALGQRLSEHFGVRRFPAPMVLEGGSITVDGEGTLITTESCLLHPSRNPDLTKDQIERCLMDYLGVEKVIWLKAGLGLDEDPDTDGHVDGVAFFAGPGRVVLHMVRDPRHPDYGNFLENRRRLETTDARGRELEVVELDARSGPVTVGGVSIVETYINSYFANGGLVVPTAGTADDERALALLQTIVPEHKVVGVPCPVVAYGGGGIHCITQQVPATTAS